MISRRAARLVFLFGVVPYLGLLLLSYLPIVGYPAYSVNLLLGSAMYLLPFCAIGALAYLAPRYPPKRVLSSTRRSFSAGDHVVLFWLTLIYILFTLYRYLVIGSVLENGITGARYEEIYGGGGVGGIFTAVPLFLSGAPALLMISTMTILNRTGKSKTLSLAVVALGFIVSFLSGGRASFLLNASYVMVFLMIIRPAQGATLSRMVRKVRKRYKYLALLGFVAMVGFSLYLFVERAALRSTDMLLRLILFSQDYNFDIFIPETDNPLWSSLWLIFVMLYYYFTGAYSYADLYWSLPTHEPLGGGYSFFTFYYLVEKLSGFDLAPDMIADIRVFGAYYTLPGSFLIDFGIIGVGVATFILAVVVLKVVDSALRGARSMELMAAFLLTVLAFAPLFSAFALASGPSLFFLSAGFSLRFVLGKQTKQRFEYGQTDRSTDARRT